MDDVRSNTEQDPHQAASGDSSRPPEPRLKYPLGVPYWQNGMIYKRRKVSDG